MYSQVQILVVPWDGMVWDLASPSLPYLIPPEMLKFVYDIYIVAVAAAVLHAIAVAVAVADLLPLAFVLIVVLLDGNHAVAVADLRGCLYTRNFDGIDPKIKSHHYHKRRYCSRDNHCFHGSSLVSHLRLLRHT